VYLIPAQGCSTRIGDRHPAPIEPAGTQPTNRLSLADWSERKERDHTKQEMKASEHVGVRLLSTIAEGRGQLDGGSLVQPSCCVKISSHAVRRRSELKKPRPQTGQLHICMPETRRSLRRRPKVWLFPGQHNHRGDRPPSIRKPFGMPATKPRSVPAFRNACIRTP
jgi:hypothetical protein